MLRCFALTGGNRRCKNHRRWWKPFCPAHAEHGWNWLIAIALSIVASLVVLLGAAAWTYFRHPSQLLPTAASTKRLPNSTTSSPEVPPNSPAPAASHTTLPVSISTPAPSPQAIPRPNMPIGSYLSIPIREPSAPLQDSDLNQFLARLDDQFRTGSRFHKFEKRLPCFPLEAADIITLSSLVSGSSGAARGNVLRRLLALPVCQALADAEPAPGFGVQGERLWDSLDLTGAVIQKGGKMDAEAMGRFAYGLRLADSQLSQFRFTSVDLRTSTFSGAHLDRVTFWESSLKQATFDHAYVASTDFVGSDLRGSSFRNVLFKQTRFGASILCGADFSGARGLTAGALQDAVVDKATTLPVGIAPSTLRIFPRCEDNPMFSDIEEAIISMLRLRTGAKAMP